MPVVSNKRVVGSIVAITAVGVGAYSWYKRSRRKLDESIEPIPEEEEEALDQRHKSEETEEFGDEKLNSDTNHLSMPIERRIRGDSSHTPATPPSTPAQQPLSPLHADRKPSEVPPPQTQPSLDFSWSEAVQNPEEAVRVINAKFNQAVTINGTLKEEPNNADRRHSDGERGSDKEAQEVQRVFSKKTETPSQVSPASSNTSSGVSSKVSNSQSVESPFAASDIHSEASQDSGTGGSTMVGSMSPAGEHEPIEAPPFYEFEIPKSIVGLIIGKKGIVIKDLTNKSGTFILIRDHHLKPDYKICSIEGTRDQINSCLRQIRRRFPPSRYPELNLNPLLPPPITSPTQPWGAMIQLSLPEGVRSEVSLSCIVDAGHIFLQQPTHPSYPALSKLDQFMVGIYSQEAGVPELPKPVETGVICAAPSLGGWYRAMTCIYYEDSEEVLLKFVDYGGYSRQPASDLKQIRSDFMNLPFQATECYLNDVTPIDEEAWAQETASIVQDVCAGKGLEVEVISYAPDGIPNVNLHVPDQDGSLILLNRFLVENGYAAPAAEKGTTFIESQA